LSCSTRRTANHYSDTGSFFLAVSVFAVENAVNGDGVGVFIEEDAVIAAGTLGWKRIAFTNFSERPGSAPW